MSAARECPLCPPNITAAEHNEIWYAYQDSMSYEAAASRAAELNLHITARDVNAHLKNHRWEQPPPRGNLRRGHALEKVAALPNERLRATLLLLSRVKALSGTQIAETIYWTGDERRWHSQRNQCYRDLRRLLYADLIYRVPAQANRPTGDSRRIRQDQMMLYFLGRDAVPFVEEREGHQLSRRDWVTRAEQVGDPYRMLLTNDEAAVVATLQRQMKATMATDGSFPLLNTPAALTFNPLNWWSGQRVTLRFEEPVSGLRSLTPGGFAAFGIRIPARRLSMLTPFFYEYDPGLRTPARYAEQLLNYLALSRTAALSERYPDLPAGTYTPPTLIVCRDPRRVPVIQREAQQAIQRALLGQERPPVLVITDEQTFSAHGLTGDCWLSLWDSAPTGRRLNIIEVLLRASAPLLRDAQHLSADSELLCDPSGATRARAL